VATLELEISAEALQQLRELPQQIVDSVETAQRELEGILAGEDAASSISGVLGDLSALATAAEEIPGVDDVVGALRELVEGLPDALGLDVAAAEAGIAVVLALVEPVRDLVDGGSLEAAVDTALERALDVAGSLTRDNEELLELRGELEEFFRLFGQLLGFASGPVDPSDVAELLSRALVGVRIDLLDAPAAALEAALAPLAGLLPDGPDLVRWRGAPAAQLALWQGLDARLTGTVDWPVLEAELSTARVELLEVIAVRDRLLAAAVAGLGRLTLPGLGGVATALVELPRPQIQQLTPILTGFRLQLQGIAAELEGWNPTPEEARALVAGVVARISHFAEESALGQLRALLVNFEQRVLRAIDELPFRDLAAELSRTLRDLAERIDVVDPDLIRGPLAEFLDGIRTTVDGFADDAVSSSIGQVWDTVEQVLENAAELLETLRSTLDGLLGTLESFTASLEPTIDPIVTQLDTLRVSLEKFDLSEGAEAVIESLHSLRDVVASIDVSSLPEPLVATVNQAADALRAIDVAGEISEPLDNVLETIDPSPLVGQITVSLEAAVEPLRLLDPATLAADLDAPIDELLATFARFDPAALRAELDEALAPVLEPLRSLDFTELLAPLTRLYAELLARVDAVLDPEPLFAPLEELFQPVLDLVDALEPARLLGALDPHSESVGEGVAAAAHPPAVVASQGGTLRTALPSSGVDVDDELFGFRPGDLLIPLIDLHAKLMEVFEALDDSILEPAAQALRESLYGRLRNLDPASVLERVGTAHAELGLELDPAPVSSRLADAALAYQGVAGKIAAASALELSTSDQAAAARITVALPELDPLRLVPALAQADALAQAGVAFDANAALRELRGAFPSFEETVGGLLPGFLADGDLGAGTLRAALEVLDPAPVRTEINALFDEIGHKLVALEPALVAALEEACLAAEEFLLPVTPSTLLALADRLHEAVRAQVEAIGPAAFKDDLAVVFATVRGQLAAFDPAVVAGELNELRDGLLETLSGVADGLLPDPAPFHELQARLAALKPSGLLASVSAAAAPLTELLAALDPAALLTPLVDAIARIREQLPQVIVDIETAFDEVLDAFPEGGVSGASVSVSASASVG